jgi:hypothetical protein
VLPQEGQVIGTQIRNPRTKQKLLFTLSEAHSLDLRAKSGEAMPFRRNPLAKSRLSEIPLSGGIQKAEPFLRNGSAEGCAEMLALCILLPKGRLCPVKRDFAGLHSADFVP